MNLKLGEDYHIKSDGLNYILYKRHLSDPNHRFSKGEPKESWYVVGYYSNIEHLVKSLLDKEIKDSDAESLRLVMDLLTVVKNSLIKRLEKLK